MKTKRSILIIAILSLISIRIANAQWSTLGYFTTNFAGCGGADYIGAIDNTIYVSSSYTYGDNLEGWYCASEICKSIDDGNNFSILNTGDGFNVFAINGSNYYKGIGNYVNMNNGIYHPIDTITGH